MSKNKMCGQSPRHFTNFYAWLATYRLAGAESAGDFWILIFVKEPKIFVHIDPCRKGRKVNLKALITTQQATDNRPAPRQIETRPSGLPVRTRLRAGNLLIGTDSNGPMPTGPSFGIADLDKVEA
jgi:hypothetical protein